LQVNADIFIKQRTPMEQYQTRQEEFWAGEFGDSYVDRNDSSQLTGAKAAFWTKVLSHARQIKSVIELGANIGLNLRAIQSILPEVSLAGVEINKKAYSQLCQIPDIRAYNESVFDFSAEQTYTLSVSCGLMIHINPEFLPVVYDVLYRSTDKYILVAEYYNPTPVTVNYRGYGDRLFKRDFPGEMLERFSDLSLVDYGFVYHGDPKFPLDDLHWFLLTKQAG